MTSKSVIARRTLVSAEGATFRIYRIELTEEGRAMLTTDLTHGIRGSNIRAADNHRKKTPSKGPPKA
jgi:hypothetical protein